MLRGVRGPGCCSKSTNGFCCLCSALSGSSTNCPSPPLHPFPPLLPSLLSREESPSRTPSSDFDRRTHRAKAGRGTIRNIFHVTHSPGSAFRCRAHTWDPTPFLGDGYVLNWGEPCSPERGFSQRLPPPPEGYLDYKTLGFRV